MLQVADHEGPVWAALHEALDSPGTTTLDAWHALDTAWTAMTGLNTAKEAMSHMQHMASSLRGLASAPGWTKLNFPMGLSIAVMLDMQRYLTSIILYETCEHQIKLVTDSTLSFSVH